MLTLGEGHPAGGRGAAAPRGPTKFKNRWSWAPVENYFIVIFLIEIFEDFSRILPLECKFWRKILCVQNKIIGELKNEQNPYKENHNINKSRASDASERKIFDVFGKNIVKFRKIVRFPIDYNPKTLATWASVASELNFLQTFYISCFSDWKSGNFS